MIKSSMFVFLQLMINVPRQCTISLQPRHISYMGIITNESGKDFVIINGIVYDQEFITPGITCMFGECYCTDMM